MRLAHTCLTYTVVIDVLDREDRYSTLRTLRNFHARKLSVRANRVGWQILAVSFSAVLDAWDLDTRAISAQHSGR